MPSAVHSAPRIRRRVRRRCAAAVVGVSTAVGLVAAVAGPAAPDAGASGVISGVTRGRVLPLAPGVTQYHERFRTSDGFSQSAWITTVDLTRPGVRLGVVAAHDVVDSWGETVLAMAQRTRAIAGVNGDLFDFGGTGAPYGGEVSGGSVVRSPVSGRIGQLAVLADHRAVIGTLGWTGALTRLGTAGVSHAVAVNTVGIARGGGITVLTRAMGPVGLPQGCVVASGTRRVSGGTAVDTVTQLRTRLTRLDRLPVSTFALLGCSAGARWLQAHAPVGSRFAVHGTVTTAAAPHTAVVAALQGARLVLRHGVRYTDMTTSWRTSGHNPETFVCVARNHTSVLLGTIDGRLWSSVGVTFPQLTAYMLGHGCYDGLVLDGGGSTTAVGPTTRGGPVGIRNVPAWGGLPRPVANGVFVYYRPPS